MSKQREGDSNGTIIDGSPDVCRSHGSGLEDDDYAVEHLSESEDDCSFHHAHTLHYNPSGETEDAARNRRFQTNRQFAASKANHAYYKRVSESRVKKPPFSNKRLIKNFWLANENLKVKWQECSAAYAEKLAMAEKHSKPMEPRTKTELVNNLKRKYKFFEKKLYRLPLVNSVNTDLMRLAYLDDAGSIMKNLDAFIAWEWDNQAIEYMGF